MIWKLFRPKPILHVCLPGEPEDVTHKLILKDLEDRMEGNYIVILTFNPNITEAKIGIIK